MYRNLVADQTISSICCQSALDCGPAPASRAVKALNRVATEAHLVKVDPSNGAVLTDVVPVPGAASINELSIGPDGNLWGLADGIVFVANPTTGAVLRQIPVFSGRTGANDGALQWRDGYLYGVTGGRLFVVDSLGGASTVLRDHGLNRLTQTPDGTYYTLLRPDGWTNPTNLASYTATGRHVYAVGPPDDGVDREHQQPRDEPLHDLRLHADRRTAGCRSGLAEPRRVRQCGRQEGQGAGDGRTVERWEGVLIRVAAARSNVGQ